MALVVWLVTGLINMICSFCFAELALTFPKVGSVLQFLLIDIKWAFLKGWLNLHLHKRRPWRDVFIFTHMDFVYFCGRLWKGNFGPHFFHLLLPDFLWKVTVDLLTHHSLSNSFWFYRSGCEPPIYLVRLVASLVSMLITVLQCFSSRWAIRLQTISHWKIFSCNNW